MAMAYYVKVVICFQVYLELCSGLEIGAEWDSLLFV